MIKIFDYNKVSIDEILNRDNTTDETVNKAVLSIMSDVKENGDEALFKYSEKFDGAKLSSLEVSKEEIKMAVSKADPDFIKTLEMARDNITAFHQKQLHNDFVTTDKDGVLLGQKYTAIEKAGLYVPGGTASYPSTVLMDAIPAKIAGVEEIVMVTPPLKDGSVNLDILVAAHVAGVDRIFKIGGAQAIAALAYGTESVPKVYKIVGPGNIYVSCAKRFVYGVVDIDMIAGPSEILVIADKDCNPKFVAADLLSQAEHDTLASSVLITPDKNLAQAVCDEIEVQIKKLDRHDIARKSIDQNGKVIIVKDLNEAVCVSNEIAPEHLELCVSDPFSLLSSVKNAGSIFMGRHVPEALGDYFAGPNHTLPTSGTAKFSSPLSVDDFLKKSSFIYYSEKALDEIGDRVVDFATREGLTGHAESVSARLRNKN